MLASPVPGLAAVMIVFGDALASDATLQLGQLGLATHVRPPACGQLAAIERAIGAYEAVRWPTGKVTGGNG